MPQLNFATFFGQIIWLMLFFSVLYTFIKRYFIPHIGMTLVSREKEMERNIKKCLDFKLSIDLRAIIPSPVSN